MKVERVEKWSDGTEVYRIDEGPSDIVGGYVALWADEVDRIAKGETLNRDFDVYASPISARASLFVEKAS